MNKKFITDVVVISDLTSSLYEFYYACSSSDFRSVLYTGLLMSQSKSSFFWSSKFSISFRDKYSTLFKTSKIKKTKVVPSIIRIVTFVNEMFNNPRSRIFVLYNSYNF